jgi:hypothetical protein
MFLSFLSWRTQSVTTPRWTGSNARRSRTGGATLLHFNPAMRFQPQYGGTDDLTKQGTTSCDVVYQ